MTTMAALLLSSCGTYTGQGAYAGASLGGILGSAIGGLSGGWRGSDVGTLIGVAGGAAVGAAVGAAADQKVAERSTTYRQRKAERTYSNRSSNYDGGTYDNDVYYDATGSGDDRIDFESGTAARPQAVETAPGVSAERDGISISNVRFIDNGRNGRTIGPNETCKISFEVRNTSDRTLYNVKPMVLETTGNRHLQVSQAISVESIQPGRGVRYTAMIRSDRRLKDGTASFRVSVYNPATDRSVSIDNIEIETRDR